jgi:hypothetical protein
MARAATLKPFGCRTPMTKAGPIGQSTAAPLHAMLSLKVGPMTNVDLALIATTIVSVIILTSAAAALVLH